MVQMPGKQVVVAQGGYCGGWVVTAAGAEAGWLNWVFWGGGGGGGDWSGWDALDATPEIRKK